jgi:type VI secretion system protein ImpM
MKAGLFGKLPAKRDFIAANAPRRFLEVWEPWLQSGIATSRQMLGADWNEIYNRAPIWRFWLGADFTGEATIGAFMASVDGVGRSFPLTVFASEGLASLPPPEIDANNSWCEATEGVLLDALAPEAAFEGVAAAVEALAPPSLQPRASEISGLQETSEGAVVVRGVDHKIELAFRAARRFGHRRTFAAQSFWWTIGGDGFEPLAFACVGLPLATRFADFLTGAFAPPPMQDA